MDQRGQQRLLHPQTVVNSCLILVKQLACKPQGQRKESDVAPTLFTGSDAARQMNLMSTFLEGSTFSLLKLSIFFS